MERTRSLPFLADDWVNDNDRLGNGQILGINQVDFDLVVYKD